MSTSSFIEIVEHFYHVDPGLEEYRSLKRMMVRFREAALSLDEFGLVVVQNIVENVGGKYDNFHRAEAAVLWWEERHPGARPA